LYVLSPPWAGGFEYVAFPDSATRSSIAHDSLRGFFVFGEQRGAIDPGSETSISSINDFKERHMSKILSEVLQANANYSANFGEKGKLALPPARRFAILTCMDARLDPAKFAGLSEGDAHVIRNAGGVVTDDEIRSLAISQRLLGTEEIILVHHTDCGMLTFTDDEFKLSIQDETGIKPEWAVEAFSDLETDVRQSIARIKASPFIPRKESVRGFIYEVETGRLREVV